MDIDVFESGPSSIGDCHGACRVRVVVSTAGRECGVISYLTLEKIRYNRQIWEMDWLRCSD
jgi:hypothetical protein